MDRGPLSYLRDLIFWGEGRGFVEAEGCEQITRLFISRLDNGCPQKKCLEAIFSIIETTYNGHFFVIEITGKVLSLSKFWRHLANVKIVKIRHLNGHISYIKQY